MSTVKISQLPTLASLDANTSNSLFMGVDVTSGVTGKFTAHTLAQGLFSNEILNVGNNSVIFPNTIAQFAGNSETYLQINLQNFDSLGSGDFVITADTGTNANAFINLGINNSDFSDTEFSAMSAYDGYLYVEGPANTGAIGNLIIGSSATGTGVKFVAGGTTDEDVVAEVKHGGFYLRNGHEIHFDDGSTQTHSATFAESFANGAFVRANSAYDAGNTLTTFSGNAYDKANSGATFANAAFTRANSGYGVANSAASFANGAFVMANSSYDKANSGATFANGAFTRANSGYDAANSAASFANSAFTQANTNTTTVASAYDHANASYDYANTSLQNTSSIVVNTNLTVPGTLTVSGPLYAANTIRVPNVYPGSQTAITLSFQNSSLEKVNIAADLAITLASFVPGKFIDLFVTNTTGQGKTITHGCSAINSTVGATTFTLAASRTAYLRYTSFNAELANAFVTITYA